VWLAALLAAMLADASIKVVQFVLVANHPAPPAFAVAPVVLLVANLPAPPAFAAAPVVLLVARFPAPPAFAAVPRVLLVARFPAPLAFATAPRVLAQSLASPTNTAAVPIVTE